jgi:hypothetical protein
MKPRRYYIFPTATPIPAGIHYERMQIGATQSFGHFDWSGYPALQAAFEATSGVQALGTLMHPAPTVTATALAATTTTAAPMPEINSALTAAGVLSTDPMVIVVEKMQKKFGGFSIHV